MISSLGETENWSPPDEYLYPGMKEEVSSYSAQDEESTASGSTHHSSPSTPSPSSPTLETMEDVLPERFTKKRKISETTSVGVLNLEDLNLLNSTQFDATVMEYAKSHLPKATNDEIKKMRRLIKNRESAHLSRLRKKEQFDVLHQTVDDLKMSNSLLSQQVTSLKSQNESLNTELAHLRKTINEHNCLSLNLLRPTNLLLPLHPSNSPQPFQTGKIQWN